MDSEIFRMDLWKIKLTWWLKLIIKDYLAFISSFIPVKVLLRLFEKWLVTLTSDLNPGIKDAVITSVPWVFVFFKILNCSKILCVCVCKWRHSQCTNSHLLNRALFIILYPSPIGSFFISRQREILSWNLSLLLFLIVLLYIFIPPKN